jgi:hypothetical protein
VLPLMGFEPHPPCAPMYNHWAFIDNGNLLFGGKETGR